MEKDDKILKGYFSKEFEEAKVLDNFEDQLMQRIEMEAAKKEKPLVRKSLRIFFAFLGIAIPLISIILGLTAEHPGIDNNWNVNTIANSIMKSPAIPIALIIFLFIAFDVLLRYRKKMSR